MTGRDDDGRSRGPAGDRAALAGAAEGGVAAGSNRRCGSVARGVDPGGDLGPPDGWPETLKTIAAVVAAAPQPMFAVWGPRRIILYNDAFAPLPGCRHPDLLGRPVPEAWPDLPQALRALIDRAMAGEPARRDDLALPVGREGSAETRNFSISCTPLRDPATGQRGLLGVCTDVTGHRRRERLEAREVSFRAAVADALRTLSDPDEVLETAIALLGRHLEADWATVARAPDDRPGNGGRGAETAATWPGGDGADAAAADAAVMDALAQAACTIAGLGAGRTLVVENVADLAPVEAQETLCAAGVGALIAAPLQGEGQSAACLIVASRAPRAWTSAEAAVVEEVAGRSWAAAGRLRAQADLRASGQRFRVALRSTPTIVFQQDRELRYTWIHDPSDRLDAALGRTDAELLSPADAARIIGLKRQVLETGKPLRTELAVRRHGTDRIYDVNLEPLRDAAGAIVGLTGGAYDITAPRAAARSLAESEARYRAVFENAAVGIAHLDTDGRWLMVNDRMCEIMGYPRDEMLALTFQDMTHPDDLERDLDCMNRMMAGEISSYSMEKRYFRKTGELVWGHLSVGAVRTAQGAITGFVSVVADVTQRRRAMEAARESEGRFRTMADNAPVMMWVSDADGACTYLNRVWGEYTGQAPADGKGDGWLDCVHPDDRRRVTAAFDVAARDRAPLRTEYRLRRADGGWAWALDAAAPRLSEDGGFHGYIGSIIDIDERHKAERHRQLLIDELNHRVKNTLAVIQVIARQTFGSGPQLRAFAGRIAALSSAHDLLTRESWARACLADLVVETLRLADPDGSRTRAEGPRIVLSPKRAVTIALALHELATNAAKYGALSGEAGTVEVTWSVIGDPPERLTLCWQERGGPPVEPPARRGFGTRMINEALALELVGVVDLDFRPEGVTCRIEAPVDLPPDALG